MLWKCIIFINLYAWLQLPTVQLPISDPQIFVQGYGNYKLLYFGNWVQIDGKNSSCWVVINSDDCQIAAAQIGQFWS